MKTYTGHLQFEKANELIDHLFQYWRGKREEPDISGVDRLLVLAGDSFNTLERDSDGFSGYERSKRIIQAAFIGYFEVERNGGFEFRVSEPRDKKDFKGAMDKIYGMNQK